MSRMIVRLDNSVGVAHSKIDATLEYLEKESTLVKGYDEHAGKKHTDSKSTKNEQSVPESSILNTNGFRGKIYLADMSPVVGSEMGGVRPVIVVSNDINNKYSPLMTIVPITSQISKTKLPTHVEIGRSHGLDRDSVVLAEQIRTIDRNRLTSLIVTLNAETMDKIDDAIKIQLGQLDF